jgi:[ribosomal protein S18]-alanine N-acetyltransferase
VSFILLSPRDVALSRLAGLHALCFPADAWDEAAFGAIFAMPGSNGRVAADAEGTLLGLILDLCLGEEAEILTFGVVPAARRQGIARSLLADFLARARAAGADRAVLEVAADNLPALSLYEARGFRRLGKRLSYYLRKDSPPVDAWRLGRNLRE